MGRYLDLADTYSAPITAEALEGALQSPALDLLLRLEREDYAIDLHGGRVTIEPATRLTAAEHGEIQTQQRLLVLLVRYCLELAK